jgi:hypothetical protein
MMMHQRQPADRSAGEKRDSRGELTPTLRAPFQLMVPLDFKAAARDTERLVLMLDGYTANLPWEMLQADDEPMVLKTRVVRQLVSSRFRNVVRPSTGKTACIIADPSTDGFQEAFGKTQPLPRLPGAEEEGKAVGELLTTSKYQVEFVPSESSALDVMARLFKRPYRILMIAAHGEFELTTQRGGTLSGVVLSDGMLLTAAEIGQLEMVPDLVFLNCCHLGQVDAVPAYNRLAYSLARELIEMGVRCVVAAGWRVNDQAARTFAEAFFKAFVEQGKPFGDAVFEARKKTHDRHPACNTWGAYQAYGDPGFVLEPGRSSGSSRPPAPVAPQELVAELDRLRLVVKHAKIPDFKKIRSDVRERLSVAPSDWSDLPEVQFALGALYGEFGADGFEMACTAYERAIAEEDKAGRVPVKAIEQVANLEARIGEKKGGEEGLRLINRAITRLEGLRACAEGTVAAQADHPDQVPGAVRRTNVERCSILGSALKRKAALLAKKDVAKWDEILETLRHSRDAYAAGESDPRSAQFDPYPALNRLQLAGLLRDFKPEDTEPLVQIAKRCADLARQRFAVSYDFFDAVMAADAELAIRMIDGSLKESTAALSDTYIESVSGVPKSARQFDSVVRQIELLARFYSLRGKPDDTRSAAALREIAQRFGQHRCPGRPRIPATNAPSAEAPSAREETVASPPAGSAPKGETAKGTRTKKGRTKAS